MRYRRYIKLNHRLLAEVLIARRLHDDAKFLKQTQINKK